MKSTIKILLLSAMSMGAIASEASVWSNLFERNKPSLAMIKHHLTIAKYATDKAIIETQCALHEAGNIAQDVTSTVLIESYKYMSKQYQALTNYICENPGKIAAAGLIIVAIPALAYGAKKSFDNYNKEENN